MDKEHRTRGPETYIPDGGLPPACFVTLNKSPHLSCAQFLYLEVACTVSTLCKSNGL